MMTSIIPTKQELSQAIDELPSEVLGELSNFIAYLRFKVNSNLSPTHDEKEEGSNFLMSIVGLGSSDETDLSERDEDILAAEVDPIRGFSHQ
jgi:hypothetical protein